MIKLSKKLIAIVGTIIICIFGLGMLSSCNNGPDAIADAKSIVWKGDGVATASISDMCDLIFKDQDWSSSQINKTMYDVTVIGTVEDDIPGYRNLAGQSIRATFEVDYYGDHFELQYVDGSFPGSSNPSIEHMYAMWKICSGNQDVVLFDNLYTTNTKFPIYEMYSEPTPTPTPTPVETKDPSDVAQMEQYTPGDDISAHEAAGDDLVATTEIGKLDTLDKDGYFDEYRVNHIYNLEGKTLNGLSRMIYNKDYNKLLPSKKMKLIDFFNSNASDPSDLIEEE